MPLWKEFVFQGSKEEITNVVTLHKTAGEKKNMEMYLNTIKEKNYSELQIRGDIKNNSKIIFLIFQ